MKNFRKVLALILVVATLFSFVAMASAKTADEYSDYEDVKYVEAVDVLTAIGITEGYDGAYHPADPIDRDEVAAMVARLRNGGDLDADLYVGADNVFADVKGQWSEGYVTYCAQLGIIAGRNASTFDPDGKVTGTEVMKMLLCVLGYDAAEQGYTGANWQVNVVRDAKKADLLIEGVDPYAAATRDEVAQYFLNALKAKMVMGYIGEGLIKITNSIWTDFDQFDLDLGEVITPDSTNAYGYEVTYCNAVISDDYLWESIPGLKFDDVTAAADCYGRPGYVWTFGKDFEKFYALTPDASVTSGFSVLAYADEIDDGYEFVSYLDGFYMDEAEGAAVLGLETGAGNGVLTEVYVLDAAETVLIVSKSTYIAEVDYINSYNGAIDLADETGYVIATIDDPGVELEVGDKVLFSLCNGGYNHGGEAPEVDADSWLVGYYTREATATTKGLDLDVSEGLFLHEIEVVEPVVAEIEYGHIYDDINKSNVTASGKTYSYNVNYTLMYAANINNAADAVIDYTEVADEAEYDLYLDAYGNIIWAEIHSEEPEYFYAYVEPGMSAVLNGINLGDRQDITADTTITGSLVNYTGKGGELKAEKTTVDANLWNTMFIRGGDFELDFTMNDTAFDAMDWEDYTGVGMLMRYTKDEDGEFVFAEEPVIGEDIAYYAAPGAKLGKASWKLDEGVYADGDTVFMIRTPDGKYTEVVGFENLDRDYMAETVIGLGNTAFTNIQYFVDGTYADVDEDGHDVMFATYVFINAKYTKAAANHFLVIDDQEFYAFDLNIADVYKNNYFAYTALVDGVKSIVLVGEEFADEVEVGSLYKGAIELIDTSCCPEHKLPIYVWATEVEPNVDGDPIHDNYLRKDSKGNVWVCASDVLDSNPGEYAIAKLAKDAKIYTILVELTESGSDVIDAAELDAFKVISVQEQTDAIMNVADAEMEVEYGWILWNSTKTEITAIYRITDSFAD